MGFGSGTVFQATSEFIYDSILDSGDGSVNRKGKTEASHVVSHRREREGHVSEFVWFPFKVHV